MEKIKIRPCQFAGSEVTLDPRKPRRLLKANPGGGGGYSHTLPIRVCAAQRGRGFEAADLPEGDGGGLKKREGGGEGKSLAYERGSVRGKRFCVIINRIVSTWQETYSG